MAEDSGIRKRFPQTIEEENVRFFQLLQKNLHMYIYNYYILKFYVTFILSHMNWIMVNMMFHQEPSFFKGEVWSNLYFLIFKFIKKIF